MSTMPMNTPIADKLRVTQCLPGQQRKYTSPSWHFDELARTEQAIESGQMEFMDWEKAKQSIRWRAEVHCSL
jgi:hypothetical protein